jgi:hypothetical protein
MRRTLWLVLAVIMASTAGVAQAQASAGSSDDDRPMFILKNYSIRGYKIESRDELKGIGKGLQVLVLSLTLPEAECQCKELGIVQRLFVLDGERVELDSFVEDGIEDAIEPSVNTPTFFNLKWSVTKSKPAMLVLTGVTPQQNPGEKVKTAQRTLVLGWSSDGGFEAVADVTSSKAAVVGPTDVRVPLQK